MNIRCAACGSRMNRELSSCASHFRGVELTDSDVDSSPLSAPPSSPVFIGYRVLGILGQGGFGVIYKAEPVSGGPPVVIKMARPDSSLAESQLRAEIEALARIGPPHVPALLRVGELADGAPYAVMALAPGATLGAWMAERSEPAPLLRIAGLASSILLALEGVHASGYVHLDLKPENILIDDAGAATIIDLGLVRRREAARMSAATMAVGTAEYMAPELCAGDADVDARADIYAMGVIVYELLSGRPPFWGRRAVVRQSQISRRPPRLDGAPAGVEDVVLRCLSKDRRERFVSAAELRAALEVAFAEALTEPVVLSGLPLVGGAPSSEIGGPASDGPHDRRRVGLLFFETETDTLAVQQRLRELGGQLGHASGAMHVGVYGHDVGEHPARRSARAANALVEARICQRAFVDVAHVSVQVRPSGALRFLSPLFTRADRYPDASTPAGVSLSRVAAEVVGGPDEARASRLHGRHNEREPGDFRPDVTVREPVAPPLVGRGEILATLRESAARAEAESLPTITRVIGEAGHGKSYLAAALAGALRAQSPGALVISLCGGDGGPDMSATVARELLKITLDLPASPPLDGGRALLRERLGQGDLSEHAWPTVALELGWISSDAPELRALRAAPSALRTALISALADALRRASAETPLHLVLDDAHLADDDALSAIELATRAESRAPIWVCALARPSFERARVGFGERAGAFEALSLGPLDPESAEALLRRLLAPAERIPAASLRALIERAHAVPLHLVELVRGIKREGIFRKHPDSRSYYLANDELDRLPELPIVDWMAEREIDALSTSLRSHARLVALLGSDVAEEDIAGVLARLDRSGGALDLPLDAAFATKMLVLQAVLVQRSGRRVSFRRELVREAVVRGAPPSESGPIYRAMFAYYRDATELPEERRLAALARSAAECGLHATAAGAYLTLAERAAARHLYVDAERLYSRTIEQLTAAGGREPRGQGEGRDGDGPGGEGQTEEAPRSWAIAHRGRGLMRYRLGRYHDALDDLAQAREAASARADVEAEVDILLDEATLLDWMNDYMRSEERVARARELAGEVASPLLQARLLLGMGRSVHRRGREQEARGLLERAADLAARLGDAGYETRVIALLMLGFILQGIGGAGCIAEAERALDQAIVLCNERGDQAHLGAAVNNRALLRASQGDKRGMLEDLTYVLAIARELGQATMELVGEYNIGEYLYLMGHFEQAERHAHRALVMEANLTGGAPRAVIEILGARLRLRRGDEEGARSIARRLMEAEAKALASPDDAARAAESSLMSPSDSVLCSMVELATRDASEDEWAALDARSVASSIGPERIEVLEARFIAARRWGRGAADQERAWRALWEAAAAIPSIMGDRLRMLAPPVGARGAPDGGADAG